MAPARTDDSPGVTPRPPAMPKSLNESLLSESPHSYQSSMREPISLYPHDSRPGVTFAHQDSLKKLPIPDLDDSCRKYLDAVRPLQTRREHEETKAAVEHFLKTDGPELQERLKKYANNKSSYIEQFCRWPVVCCDITDASQGMIHTSIMTTVSRPPVVRGVANSWKLWF